MNADAGTVMRDVDRKTAAHAPRARSCLSSKGSLKSTPVETLRIEEAEMEALVGLLGSSRVGYGTVGRSRMSACVEGVMVGVARRMAARVGRVRSC